MKKFISILALVFGAATILSSCGKSHTSGIRLQDRNHGWNTGATHKGPDIGSLGSRRVCDCSKHW